jgi:hypothetical protein
MSWDRRRVSRRFGIYMAQTSLKTFNVYGMRSCSSRTGTRSPYIQKEWRSNLALRSKPLRFVDTRLTTTRHVRRPSFHREFICYYLSEYIYINDEHGQLAHLKEGLSSQDRRNTPMAQSPVESQAPEFSV